MASLVTRRQSFGNHTPRIVIPPRHSKDESNYDSNSPISDVDSSEQVSASPPTTPPVPSGWSPELQPNTPPVINKNHDRVLQIGKYLLVEQVDNNVYKAVNMHTSEEKICKVS